VRVKRADGLTRHAGAIADGQQGGATPIMPASATVLFYAVTYLIAATTYLYSLLGPPGIARRGAGWGPALLWTLVMGAFALYPSLLERRLVGRGRIAPYVAGRLLLCAYAVWLSEISIVSTFLFYIVVSEAVVFSRRAGVAVGVASVVLIYGESALLIARHRPGVPADPTLYVELLPWAAGLVFVAGTTVLLLRAQEDRARSEELLAELTAAHRQLQTYAAREREMATAQERARLARELHDSVTQSLFSMTLHARAAQVALQRDSIDPEGALGCSVAQLRELAAGALAEMRALIFELRPNALEEEGLVAALSKQAAALRAREDLIVDVDAPDERLSLDPATEEHLYRLVQEALHNVVKHARARHVRVCLAPESDDEGALVVTIDDDGAGFDAAAVPPGHLGLGTMAERAQ